MTVLKSWLKYSKGNRVNGTRFVAFKVPLEEKYCSTLPPSKSFTPQTFLNSYPEVKLVIDLTFTSKYYDGEEEFTKKGVQYLKLECYPRVIPSDKIFKKFTEVVDKFILQNPQNYLIGVHCTHGVNRTGYLIVRYMIESLGYTPEDALKGVDWYRLVSVRLDHGVGPRGSCSQWRHTLLTCWMLFTLYTLPQLAVSAKLLCLLMVVICGAVPSMVRSVKLFGESSNKFVRINMSGHVYAADYNEKDAYLNLTIRSIDFRSRLNIYSEQAGRYLCFNKSWKLVGMRDKRKKGAMCEFLETVESRGYSRYRSIANATHFLAFNSKGKPLRYNPRLSMGYEENCINFVKIDVSFNITRHNSKLAGGINQVPDLMRWYYKDSSHARRHKGRKRKA